MNVPIDISSVILKTERLTLRPWRETDLDDFFAYASMEGVGEMCGWAPHRDKAETMAALQKYIDGKKTFAIVCRDKVIGSLGIENYRESAFPKYKNLKCRELSFVISKDYWGQGLIPEAVREVIRYLFEDIGLDAICCGHFVRNSRSARVQEKCGFHTDSYGVYTPKNGVPEEEKRNILLREEYEAQKT